MTRKAARLRLAALILVGVVAAVPLVWIGALFGLASDSALPYYLMAVLPAVPALTLWLTMKRTLRAIAVGLVIGAVSFATQVFLPVFWAVGPGSLRLPWSSAWFLGGYSARSGAEVRSGGHLALTPDLLAVRQLLAAGFCARMLLPPVARSALSRGDKTAAADMPSSGQ